MYRLRLTFAFSVCSLLLLGGWSDSAKGDGGAPAEEPELFPDKWIVKTAGRKAELRRTGIGVRYRAGIFRIYVAASYMETGDKAKNAAELLASDGVKRLKLHFLMGVSAPEMTESFLKCFRAHHPAPAFDPEIKRLLHEFSKTSVKKGDVVVLTHFPGRGLHYSGSGGAELLIENAEFSRAIWENYFGKTSSEDEMQKGLVSELR